MAPLSAIESFLDQTTRYADYFTAYPLPESEFGQMGKRVQILHDLIKAHQNLALDADQFNTPSQMCRQFPSSQALQHNALRSNMVP